MAGKEPERCLLYNFFFLGGGEARPHFTDCYLFMFVLILWRLKDWKFFWAEI